MDAGSLGRTQIASWLTSAIAAASIAASEREAGPSPAALLSPPHKLLIERRILRRQLGAICGPHAGGRRRLARACGLLWGGRLVAARVGAVVLVEPRLRRIEAFPARQGGREIDFAPFDMAWRLLEFGDLRKEDLHEPLDPRVAIEIGLRPVIRDQNRTDRNRVHGLAGRNEFRVVVVGEGRWQVVVGELLGIGDRTKMQ